MRRSGYGWSGGGVGEYRYKLDDNNMDTGAVETNLREFTPSAGSELEHGPHKLYVQEKDAAD